MAAEHLLILANWAVCAVGGWICLVRMSKMSASTTKIEIRIQYMIWFALFFSSGWSFLFGERANAVQLLMSTAVLSSLVLGVPAWRFSEPHYAQRQA